MLDGCFWKEQGNERKEDGKYLEPSVATVGMEQYRTKLTVSLNEEMQALSTDLYLQFTKKPDKRIMNPRFTAYKKI